MGAKVERKNFLIGIDEAGRGPIAGPVAVAAVLLSPRFDLKELHGIRDSKKLNPQKRRIWFEKVRAWEEQGLLDFAVSLSSHKTIDSKGIVAAIRLSLCRVLQKVCGDSFTAHIFLDGGLVAPAQYPFQHTIIRGDETISIIALASILAKVTRDERMMRYGERFPLYGFEQHKGYGTYSHYKAIRKYGVSELHRRSFLRRVIAKEPCLLLPNT